MPDTLTWGLISTARINRKLIPAIHTLPGCTLMAVASRSQERASDFADGSCMRILAYAYDACFDLMSEEEQALLRVAMAARAGDSIVFFVEARDHTAPTLLMPGLAGKRLPRGIGRSKTYTLVLIDEETHR